MKQASTIIIKVASISAAISIFSTGVVAMGAATGSAVGGWLLLYLGMFTGLVAVIGVVVAGVSLLVEVSRGWMRRFSGRKADGYVHGRLARGF